MISCKCGHSWEYKGKSSRPTCPKCDGKVRISGQVTIKKVDSLDVIGRVKNTNKDKDYYQNKLNIAITHNDRYMIDYYTNKLNDC